MNWLIIYLCCMSNDHRRSRLSLCSTSEVINDSTGKIPLLRAEVSNYFGFLSSKCQTVRLYRFHFRFKDKMKRKKQRKRWCMLSQYVYRSKLKDNIIIPLFLISYRSFHIFIFYIHRNGLNIFCTIKNI